MKRCETDKNVCQYPTANANNTPTSVQYRRWERFVKQLITQPEKAKHSPFITLSISVKGCQRFSADVIAIGNVVVHNLTNTYKNKKKF